MSKTPDNPAADPVALYRSARRDERWVVLEGLHALKHALRFGARVVEVRTPDTAAALRLARTLAPDVAERLITMLTPTAPEVFARLAPTPPSTGLIALAERPRVDPAAALERAGPAPAVLLERPTHHGNIGAAVRVAAAAGAAAVLVTGPHDPWHPASVRGAAGLQFALPVAGVDALPASERPLVAVDPEGTPAGAEPLPERALLVFGSERAGVSEPLRARAERRLAIPMRPGVSSLNLATAVAVVLYGTGAPFASEG